MARSTDTFRRLVNRNQTTRIVLLVLAGCWMHVLLETGHCQEAAAPSISAPATDDDAELSEKERETRITAGLAAVAGIATVGIGLIAVTLIWGARLRRQNREVLPAASPPSENWFLKRPRPESPRAAATEKNE